MKWAHVYVSPVVHDQAGALDKDALATRELADEVCDAAIHVLIFYSNFLIGARGHCLETCVR